jgi:HSP20 family molecular chaperone IbpA
MKIINDTTKEKVMTQSKEMIAKSQDNLERAAKEVEKSLNRYFNKYSEFFSSTFNDLYETAAGVVDFDIVSESEKDGKKLYCIDMPGVKISDVEISYLGGTVNVSATRTDYNQESKIKTTFTLDPMCDPDTAKASLKDGVLTLSFVKTEAKAFKKITVE